jgi:hypothetical protein
MNGTGKMTRKDIPPSVRTKKTEEGTSSGFPKVEGNGLVLERQEGCTIEYNT